MNCRRVTGSVKAFQSLSGSSDNTFCISFVRPMVADLEQRDKFVWRAAAHKYVPAVVPSTPPQIPHADRSSPPSKDRQARQRCTKPRLIASSRTFPYSHPQSVLTLTIVS